ncbi:unnamed protein product, partial [Rotaria sordida]
MSAIKRFFSSHKTSSNSKVNNSQHHDNQTSQNKSSNNTVISGGGDGEKLTETNETVEQEEIKENMTPTMEIPMKSDSMSSPEIESSNDNEEKKSS